MVRRRSIAEARSSLPTLVREVEAGHAVELTRRGEPVAVLVGRREFELLVARRRGFFELYESFRREVNLVEVSIDPDTVFKGLRDEARGRDVAL
jgi:prevent-host-death family protein